MMQLLIHKLANGPLLTKFGECEVAVFSDGANQALVIHKGQLEQGDDVYCRVQSMCYTGFVFSSIECDCANQMEISLQEINRLGRGLIILLEQEGRGNGPAAHIASQALKRDGLSQEDAYVRLGYASDARDYKIAGKVCVSLGLNSVRLDSSSVVKIQALSNFGIVVNPYEKR